MIFIAQKESKRLDVAVSKETNFSRSRVKKLLEDGHVKLNGLVCTQASQKIRGGEEVDVFIPEVQSPLEASSTLFGDEMAFEILHQDDDIAIINKKAGITVHPCPSCQEETLVHQLLASFPKLKNMDGERPGIVHRLDKDTSGLMIIALHEEARLILTEAFAQREVQKTYLAMVCGLCDKGESKEAIGRHPDHKVKMALVPVKQGGRDAHSEWERLYPVPKEQTLSRQGTLKKASMAKNIEKKTFSLMAVKIFTGRTHQIRVHLSEAGYALLGDGTYAQKEIAAMAPRQMLHAYDLHFYHPMTQEEMHFTCPPPADFLETAQNLLAKQNSFYPLIVTGVSGTGKSGLLEAFNALGVESFSADACVEKLYQPHADAWYVLKNQFGQKYIDEETQEVDRKALFSAMQNPIVRKEIEQIVHPLVFSVMEAFFKQAEVNAEENTISSLSSEKYPCSFAVAEIPLWFESQQKTETDYQVVCITTQNDIRHERLKKRGWSDETIAQMDAWQWSQEDKATKSDYVIQNNTTLEDLSEKVKQLLADYQEKHQKRVQKKYNEFLESFSG